MSALISNALAVLILAAIIPVGGALSDRVGRKMVLTAGAIWIACAAYPASPCRIGHLFRRISGANPCRYRNRIVRRGCIYGGRRVFSTSFRATGHAVAYQLAVAIFGGTTPLIATWLVGHFVTPVAPGYYVIAIAVVGVIAIQFVPEKPKSRFVAHGSRGQTA